MLKKIKRLFSRKCKVSDFYVPENEYDRTEGFSPSGRFKLVIRHYGTRKGCWDYSRGTVFRTDNNQEVCDIKRNYCTFHHSFVTKDGQEWLISGSDYMGQSIVNLDTGQRFDKFPKGEEFCWASHWLSKDGKTLAVEGCYWACPYEYRFFDFSDPASGWPEIEMHSEDYFLDAGDPAPEWADDGTVKCFRSHKYFKPLDKREWDISDEEMGGISDGAYDDDSNWETRVNEIATLRREGNRMVLVDTWKSDDQKEHDRKSEEAGRKWQEWQDKFFSTDELYLEANKLKREKWSLGIGGNHSIHIRFDGIMKREAELEWRESEGPIIVRLYKSRRRLVDTKEFVHDISGMRQATAAIEKLRKRFLFF